jgi:hypothetical protein
MSQCTPSTTTIIKLKQKKSRVHRARDKTKSKENCKQNRKE